VLLEDALEANANWPLGNTAS